MITIEQFLEFEEITNFPLIKLLADVKSFFLVGYPEIDNFYRGNSKQIKKEHFKNLQHLILESERCINEFSTNKRSLNKNYFWDILDSVEDLKLKLLVIDNLSKFLRSSILKGVSKSGYLARVKLENNQTIEDISNNVLFDSDSDNDWINIAIENDLKEEDWDISGGKELLIRKRIFQSDLVTTFIDNTIGDKIYGRDFYKKITFFEDDLLVLNEKDTLTQSVETLSELVKGDIPEETYLGMNSFLYKGVNFSQLNFPSITKDLKRTFRTDDLFKDLNVLDVTHSQGDIFIKFEVETKIGDVLIKNITL